MAKLRPVAIAAFGLAKAAAFAMTGLGRRQVGAKP
jgi:hypothetical protein